MTFRKLCVLSMLLVLLAVVPFSAVGAAEGGEVLIVVVGKSFPADDISFASLKSSFRAQRIQIAGKAVLPINHPRDATTRIGFDRRVLGLEPAAIGRFWIDMRIRDQGRPPTTASTPELALRIVAALAGAITYASPSMALDKWPLKVLTVDGKSIGQLGYPLVP